MDSGLIREIEKAQSTEELMAAAEKRGIALTGKEAEKILARIRKSTGKGELVDDELDSVSGGGCRTTVGGKKYVVVSSGLPCFTGRYELVTDEDRRRFESEGEPRSLRSQWEGWSGTGGNCGKCRYLRFKNGLGYCSVSEE